VRSICVNCRYVTTLEDMGRLPNPRPRKGTPPSYTRMILQQCVKHLAYASQCLQDGEYSYIVELKKNSIFITVTRSLAGKNSSALVCVGFNMLEK
jgi:hypothetical protein